MLIVDAHLDLAYNAINNGRNLRQPLADLRASEPRPNHRGTATVTFPELVKGGVGLVFGTLFVQPASYPSTSLGGQLVYKNAAEAHRMAMTQLDYYHRLSDEEEHIRLVGSQSDLDEVLASHETGDKPLLGIVPLMEGADPIREPEEAELWYERGLRIIGLAWDNTRYAAGGWRGRGEGLTKEGNHLLEVMADLGFILDLTHMSEKASLEALDRYQGPVIATHSNARALVQTERQLSDTQIRQIGERDGVIGVVLCNPFLRQGYEKPEQKQFVTLDHVAAHIDHICQLLGSARHIGIGSDMDGGFGAEKIPAEMDSISDLSRISAKLLERGFSEDDVHGIMGGNWINLLRKSLS